MVHQLTPDISDPASSSIPFLAILALDSLHLSASTPAAEPSADPLIPFLTNHTPTRAYDLHTSPNRYCTRRCLVFLLEQAPNLKR